MNHERYVLVGSVVAIATLALTGCAGDSAPAATSAPDAKKMTIRVASNLNATALPVWVAEEEGFFADQGLQVEYTSVDNIGTLPSVAGNSFDIILATPTTLLTANSQGIPLTWVAGSSVDSVEHSVNDLMVMPDSGITDVGDLAGSNLGVLVETGTLHIATLKWLQENGVAKSDVNIVQVDGPNHADQLASGRIDAVETTVPFSMQVEARGGESLGNPYRVFGDAITPILWAASTDWAQANTEAIERFKAALDDSIDFIDANDEAAREVLQERTGLADDLAQTVELPGYDTTVRVEDLAVWQDAMTEVVGFEGSLDVSELVIE